MYNYDQAMMGLGQGLDPNVDWAAVAAAFSQVPTPDKTNMMRRPDGSIIYATNDARKAMEAAGGGVFIRKEYVDWYRDPLILGGAAVIAGIIAFGLLVK